MLWGIFVLFVVSMLNGMKWVYGVRLWQGSTCRFLDIWRERQFYIGSVCWTAGYSMIWILSGKSVETVRFADLLSTYGILAAVDGKRRIVPDFILCCFFTGQMLLGVLTVPSGYLFRTVFTGILFAAAAMAFAWLSRGKMGMGDARLLGVTAMTAGWRYMLSILVLGLAASFVYSIGLIVLCKKSIQTEFPFVPFLTVGIAVHMLLFR